MSCVLTLALNPAAQECFEHLRRQWFPPALNRIPAHLTLFHTLPESAETTAALELVASTQPVFGMQVLPPRLIGRGVAYFLQSEEAMLHGRLRRAFESELTAQDRQGFRPHVVVQNKVSGDQAKVTLTALGQVAVPDSIEAVGLDLWRYLDGPWEHLRTFAFR